MLGWDTAAYARRAEAFGWRAIEIDGHDVAAIDEAFEQATAADGQPVAIVARTLKGKGVAAGREQGRLARQAARPTRRRPIDELGGGRDMVVRPPRPPPAAQANRFATTGGRSRRLGGRREGRDPPRLRRRAGGGRRRATGDVVALDGEVGNSTYSELFAKAHPDRYFEMYIAEQQLVAAAVGMQVRGWVPFASTFAAFLVARLRLHPHGGRSARPNIRLSGSHAGVSIGEDGPSQMALEDLASLRAVHGSTVLYPCCANQTAQLVEAMADRPGIVYLRTTRGEPARALPGRRDVPDRRLPDRALVRLRRRHAGRRRHHAARGAGRRRGARRRGHLARA